MLFVSCCGKWAVYRCDACTCGICLTVTQKSTRFGKVLIEDHEEILPLWARPVAYLRQVYPRSTESELPTRPVNRRMNSCGFVGVY